MPIVWDSEVNFILKYKSRFCSGKYLNTNWNRNNIWEELIFWIFKYSCFLLVAGNCQFCKLTLVNDTEALVDHCFTCSSTTRSSLSHRFSCFRCTYHSSRKNDMRRHIRKHIGDKPYKCLICNYNCTDSYTLKLHKNRHSGEKPYKCDFCEYTTSYPYGLKIHMRQHTGEKPFKCNYCDYTSKHSNAITIHTRKHTGEKPFECTNCEFKCSESNQLIRHVRRSHKS